MYDPWQEAELVPTNELKDFIMQNGEIEIWQIAEHFEIMPEWAELRLKIFSERGI